MLPPGARWCGGHEGVVIALLVGSRPDEAAHADPAQHGDNAVALHLHVYPIGRIM